MAEVLRARAALTTRETTVRHAWPAGARGLTISVDDTQFTSNTLDVTVELDLSWDAGATWRLCCTTVLTGGRKTLRGNESPWWTIGPFKTGDVLDNPGHFRVSLQRTRGGVDPIIGLRMGGDGDR